MPCHRPRSTRIAFALPAADAASAEAVAVGALLGSYYFGRYRSNGHAAPQLTLIASGDHVAPAVARAEVIAVAVNLVRDLVNTSPSHLYPETMAAEADKVAGQADLDIEILDEKALREAATAASPASARARCTRPAWSGSATAILMPPRPSSSSARESPSTPAGYH